MRAIFIHQTGGRQGEREEFGALPVRIGRSSSNDLILTGDNRRASSRHAELIYDGSAFLIKDLGSTNGTYLNGLRITQSRIKSGDILEFGLGGPKLRFDSDEQSQPGSAARSGDKNPR